MAKSYHNKNVSRNKYLSCSINVWCYACYATLSSLHNSSNSETVNMMKPSRS